MGFIDQINRVFKFVNGDRDIGLEDPFRMAFEDDELLICSAAANGKCVRFDVTSQVAAMTSGADPLVVPLGVMAPLLGSANLALTRAQSGGFIRIDGASQAYTLPAIGANDVGMRFTFFSEVVATAVTITAAAGDLLVGGVYIADFDTANTGQYFKPNGSSNVVTTFDGTTKGGKIGTKINFHAVTATQWDVDGLLFGDGTIATPFSG